MGKSNTCIIVQARMNSQRIPGKMLRSFANTTLLDILFSKLSKLTTISPKDIYLSSYEQELKDVANKHNINIFNRTKESSLEESNPLKLWEWYNQLPYEYVVLISACNPLLKIKTIDKFIESFINSDKEGAFGVFEKKTYYWDKNKKPITDWGGETIMNTKYVDPVYEAAHCLYASRMDIIEHGYFMDDKFPPELELFVMDELESFDVDYEWQFTLGEKLYDTINC